MTLYLSESEILFTSYRLKKSSSLFSCSRLLCFPLTLLSNSPCWVLQGSISIGPQLVLSPKELEFNTRFAVCDRIVFRFEGLLVIGLLLLQMPVFFLLMRNTSATDDSRTADLPIPIL